MAKTRLNVFKKMECDEDKHKDLLNGIITDMKGNLLSPTSDCNSNNLSVMKENMFLCSTDSIHDWPDFSQDNADFQWCLDYGCKYNNFHHQSILSLSRFQDSIYYDDMARNIDANLAEVDMDDFNREDIHSVLSSLPNVQGVEEREMFASVTGSMMVKFDFDSSISPCSNSQAEQINTSIYKSQLLFSPVRENYFPNTSLSVDSLDLSENDINLMVTCQSNKNNYTIAFEGSTVMTSDDSESHKTYTSGGSGFEESRNAALEVNKSTGCEPIRSNCASRSAEDSTFTTWSKIKRHPSENSNFKPNLRKNSYTTIDAFHYSTKDKLKSLSLPNLFRPMHIQNINMSLSVQHKTELCKRNFISDYRLVKLYDIQSNSKNIEQSNLNASKASNFSLVKLFMKQKSLSNDGMTHYMSEKTVGNNNSKISKNSQNFDNPKAKSWINEIENEISDKRNTSRKQVNKNNEAVKTKSFNGKDTTFLSESFVSKKHFSDINEKGADHNGYYSDESTQENGSNTESAENLTCHCVNAPVISHKKLLTEKSIQTSKVFESTENAQKKPLKVPVYILYPNYSLPNLEFLKKEHYVQNIDLSKVFLRPQKFHAPLSPVKSSKSRNHGNRPFSINDIETLKKTGFKHVKDWESLTFLLPKEYKQFLQEIPEIVSQLKGVKSSKEDVVPLFCLSPPLNRKMKKRPSSCDVDRSYDCRSCNFSSTATQPSSGYRGSSTMLNSNNSNKTSSPRNHSFSYKCDDNSESSSSRKSSEHFSHKKLSNADDSNENCSQKPFLLKSILRNNSLDCQPYTCKTQKEYANKRYSMVELSDKNLALEENCFKRRSLHNSNSKLPQTYNSKTNKPNHIACPTLERTNIKSLKMAEDRENYVKSNLKSDMRRLEELLEISAIFGENVESFTENDMVRLRSQVSKFLTMQKNLEKVSETLQTMDEDETNGFNSNKTATACEGIHLMSAKNLQTPHNTPEHKKQSNDNRKVELNAVLVKNYLEPCSCNGQIHEFEEEDCTFRDENLGGLKKTVSFAERISFAVKQQEYANDSESSEFNHNDDEKNRHQGKAKRPVDLPICEENVKGVSSNFPSAKLLNNSSDLLQKRDLILDVGSAIKKILKLCKENKEDPANMCLHHLCPTLYAVLSDGLKEEIDTPFGPIRNSVWSVIEASSRQGPMTQTLNELVQRLNREDIFTEGLIKFNAFIFGLLNARALSGWFSYLRTRDSLLRRYYDHSSLLLLSNTAGAPFRILVDHLINILEPLCSLQFNLDLMYQTKLLHCSLQNLNSLLEEPSNTDFLTPTKQFMLLKLVQSIHNSLNQSGEGKKSKHILEDIEKNTTDPPVVHLLENNKHLRIRRGESKARPKSGCDSVVAGKEITDVVSAMKKRWSGINLNSKLTEAFDRLLDESESDYTDSLDVSPPREEKKKATFKKNIQKENSSNIPSRELRLEKADTYTKEQKKNILLNLNKKSCGEISVCKPENKEKKSFNKYAISLQNGGQKLKRLQQKWEKWEKNGRSPSESDSDIQSPSERTSQNNGRNASKKNSKPEKLSCDSSTTPSPTSRISKIPRLVTSPLSSTPSAIKPTGSFQKPVLPACSNDSVQKTVKTNFTTAKGNRIEEKVSLTGGSKFSRAEENFESVLRTDYGKSQTMSPGSLHTKFNTTSAKKSNLKRSSVSLNRKPAIKLQQLQGTVRTLTHRLPSDSGHLSFNENEKLKVILEVDKAWLLCCRGNQKGLVPKSLVISDIEDKF